MCIRDRDITKLTYEIIFSKTFMLPEGPEYALDAVKRVVPLITVEFAETEYKASAQAIIDFGITHSFVGRDSPYIKLLERYGRWIARTGTMEQVVLWRNHPVRITNKFRVRYGAIVWMKTAVRTETKW